MPLSPRRRTPSDAVLEHTPEIERMLKLIQTYVKHEVREAKAGRSTWGEVTSIATLESDLRNVLPYIGK